MKFIRTLINKFKPRSYEERMNEYLSQATSHSHFQQLERDWFANNPVHLLVKGIMRVD